MMKIALFTPRGYVGSNIKRALEKNKDIVLYEITRESRLEDCMGNYDVFIYTASVTSERNESSEKYIIDNSLTAIKMISFCAEHKINRIIYLSSDEIYGKINVDCIGYQAIMVEPNIYAVTKYIAEKIIMESGIKYFILRLPGIVGKKWGNNFLHRVMDKILDNEAITLYNADKLFNNVVDIDDLVEFVINLVFVNNGVDSEIFLLGNEKKIKLIDLINQLIEMCGSKSEINIMEDSTKRYFTLDVSKAVDYGYCSKDINQIVRELYQCRRKE